MEKQALRNKYKQLRLDLSPQAVEDYSLQIANRLLTMDIWDFKMYHLFLSIEKHKEVQTDFILHALQGKDKNVILSKSNFLDYSMSHYLLTDDTRILINKWGIPEPDGNGIAIDEKQLDVVFVPLLVCDSMGNRVGYGKGFYDRFLEKCRPTVLKIGLSFVKPLNYQIETYPNDIPLDVLVCPDEIYDFRQ
ncbi:5-formyltetrahydrofolate cyclo-ligase [Nonlabens ulvanivorans]|uniref:5-formyltetrahydrofolate cyclo-ligase n=1 Tax=Nonlabens ulvanivorans TaxID=906888 RepID=A0A081D871_NONUL|nr:5-formyltetrahydrofolate cyclo-ligase [Nonlabens ulvanivorans]GAK75117.1 5-formyltetrahydrofolate cyclo-ligase [Nonlabens ulvanivorans]GAK98997.1 5-formyltetrahydrofolate cyclo-ligase [Nonlabens ulvanivorans]